MTAAPQTCTEPHPSPFLLWGSAAAKPLHWGCTVNPNPTFHQGNCIRVHYHCNMPWCVSHQGLGVVWRGGGWLIAVAFALLLSMASIPSGQLPSAQLHASEFGHLNWQLQLCWSVSWSLSLLSNKWIVYDFTVWCEKPCIHPFFLHSLNFWWNLHWVELWSPADHKHCRENVSGSGSCLQAHPGTCKVMLSWQRQPWSPTSTSHLC